MRRVSLFFFLLFFFLRTSSAHGGGGGALPDFFFFLFFPCSADYERDWPPCKVIFFGLATNALNVRNNDIFSPITGGCSETRPDIARRREATRLGKLQSHTEA